MVTVTRCPPVLEPADSRCELILSGPEASGRVERDRVVDPLCAPSGSCRARATSSPHPPPCAVHPVLLLSKPRPAAAPLLLLSKPRPAAAPLLLLFKPRPPAALLLPLFKPLGGKRAVGDIEMPGRPRPIVVQSWVASLGQDAEGITAAKGTRVADNWPILLIDGGCHRPLCVHVSADRYPCSVSADPYLAHSWDLRCCGMEGDF
jgi:hypothetical protein